MTIAACVERELAAVDIPWDLAPLPDPPLMSATEQAVEATIDALSYRLVLCEALDRLRDLTLQNDRLRTENTELRARLRGPAPC